MARGELALTVARGDSRARHGAMKNHRPRTVMLYVLCVIVAWRVIGAWLSILIKLILGAQVVAGAVTSTAGQLGRLPTMKKPRRVPPVPPSSEFAGFRCPPEVIVLAVRWYLRFGLSLWSHSATRSGHRSLLSCRSAEERGARAGRGRSAAAAVSGQGGTHQVEQGQAAVTRSQKSLPVPRRRPDLKVRPHRLLCYDDPRVA